MNWNTSSSFENFDEWPRHGGRQPRRKATSVCRKPSDKVEDDVVHRICRDNNRTVPDGVNPISKVSTQWQTFISLTLWPNPTSFRTFLYFLFSPPFSLTTSLCLEVSRDRPLFEGGKSLFGFSDVRNGTICMRNKNSAHSTIFKS